MAVALVTVPLYLHKIGEARYGILAIVWLLLGYFGIFDLGLSRATANRIAQINHGSVVERERVFWTAVGLNAGFGAIGGAILYFAARIILGNFFKMPLGLREEVLPTIPWLAVAVPLATVTGVLTGTLEARERFGVLNVLQTAGTILFSIVPLMVAYMHGADLRWLIPAAVLARTVSILPIWFAVKRFLPLRGGICFASDQVKPLLSYGGWVTVNAALGPLFSSFDSFVIGSEISAAAVSTYTVPYQMIHKAQVLPAALARSLFPRFSAQNSEESQLLGIRATSSLAVLTVPIMVAVTLVFYPFLVLWIGARFAARSSLVGEVLVLGTWMSSLAFIPYGLLQGQRKPRTVAVLHIVEAPFLLGGIWLGVRHGGIVGAAFAMSVRDVVDSLSFFILAGLLGRVAKTLLYSCAWILASLAVARLIGHSMSYHFIAAALFAVSSGVWALRLDPVAFHSLKDLVRPFVKRHAGNLS